MEWKDLLHRNWSRKAEIVVVTHVAIVLLARISDVEAAILKLAMLICGVVGFTGLIVQGVLDWRRPKRPGDFIGVLGRTGPITPADGENTQGLASTETRE